MTSLNWSSREDRLEVQRFHAPLFKRWKSRHGYGPCARTEDMPGFLESLQALHDYGYSLSDISAMWGVTRERVRQWFNQHGLERHDEHAAVRVWDDDLACFYPVSKEEYARLRQDAVRRTRAHAALAADIALVQRLAKELGRTPSLSDIAETVYGGRRVPCSGIAARWGYGTDCSYKEAMDRLYDAAGLERHNGNTIRADAEREADVQAVRDFVRDHGRAPTQRELARARGTSHPAPIAGRWGYKDGSGYGEAMDALYAAAGTRQLDRQEAMRIGKDAA